MSQVQGTADGFDRVADLAATNLKNGDELGFSLCVVRDGEIAVDLWGGVADAETGRAWERDTVVHTWSITKTMATLVILQLVDEGLVALDAPVAQYWPEFAAAGKEAVTVTHLLSHTSGVAGWQEPIDLATLCDTAEAAARLAAQEPWWTPGEGSGYAALAFGHLVGEIVQRVTGQSIGAAFAERIADPVGADYFIGTPAEVDGRIATLVSPPPSNMNLASLDPELPVVKAMTNPHLPVAHTATDQWRRAEIAGVNGHGNARSIARIQAALSHGGIAHGGHRLLSEDVVDEVYVERSQGTDRVLFAPIRFGLGLGLTAPDVPGWLPDGRVSWWAGWGGAIVVNDADRHVTMAYAMNKMTPEAVGPQRTANYVRTMWEALD